MDQLDLIPKEEMLVNKANNQTEKLVVTDPNDIGKRGRNANFRNARKTPKYVTGMGDVVRTDTVQPPPSDLEIMDARKNRPGGGIKQFF